MEKLPDKSTCGGYNSIARNSITVKLLLRGTAKLLLRDTSELVQTCIITTA